MAHPTLTAEKPWTPDEWLRPVCENCGQGGLFLGDSRVCEGCLSPCPTCHGKGVLALPVRDDVEEHPCPTCRPADWPRGFPGLSGNGEWLIPPTGQFADRTPANRNEP